MVAWLKAGMLSYILCKEDSMSTYSYNIRVAKKLQKYSHNIAARKYGDLIGSDLIHTEIYIYGD